MSNIEITENTDINELLLCKDCLHYHRPWHMILNGYSARCKRNVSQYIDLVTGKINLNLNDLARCSNERDKYDPEDTCGPKGIFWVPRKKTKENTFRLLKREQNV